MLKSRCTPSEVCEGSLQKFKPIWKQVEDEAEYQEAKKQHLLLEKAQKSAAN